MCHLSTRQCLLSVDQFTHEMGAIVWTQHLYTKNISSVCAAVRPTLNAICVFAWTLFDVYMKKINGCDVFAVSLFPSLVSFLNRRCTKVKLLKNWISWDTQTRTHTHTPRSSVGRKRNCDQIDQWFSLREKDEKNKFFIQNDESLRHVGLEQSSNGYRCEESISEIGIAMASR